MTRFTNSKNYFTIKRKGIGRHKTLDQLCPAGIAFEGVEEVEFGARGCILKREGRGVGLRFSDKDCILSVLEFFCQPIVNNLSKAGLFGEGRKEQYR